MRVLIHQVGILSCRVPHQAVECLAVASGRVEPTVADVNLTPEFHREVHCDLNYSEYASMGSAQIGPARASGESRVERVFMFGVTT